MAIKLRVVLQLQLLKQTYKSKRHLTFPFNSRSGMGLFLRES
jgi:hypothetical protein